MTALQRWRQQITRRVTVQRLKYLVTTIPHPVCFAIPRKDFFTKEEYYIVKIWNKCGKVRYITKIYDEEYLKYFEDKCENFVLLD